jgi:hypothetical protein
MSIGADLLAVPFGDMILSMATAIAKSQKELDKASLVTLRELVATSFPFIENITEVLTPAPSTVTYQVPDPNRPGIMVDKTIIVTGVDVQTIPGDPVKLNLLQAGLTPTFYQFSESKIEVKIALSMTYEASFGINVSQDFSVDENLGFDDGSGFTYSRATSWASHVDASYSSKYSYTAEGSSLLSTTLKPVPPPQRVMPRFISVNAFFSPPQVNISQ